jgi:membrane-bound metal-dependent hydrolase YbcI (DUF457 family)
VDPVSHLLFGRTIAFTTPRRQSLTGVTAALVLGSILPDVDAVLVPRGFDLYLRAHAAGTHSAAGTVVQAIVLALVLHVIVKGSRILPLFVASWVGILGHVFWDLADGSDIRVLEPFSDAVFGWHLVAMGEPIVLMILAAAVFVAWRWPVHAPTTAAVALVLLGVLLAVKKTTQDWARTTYAASVGAHDPRATEIAPDFGRLFSWTFYDRVDDRVRGWHVNGRSGDVAPTFEYRDAETAPMVTSSRRLPVVETFLPLSKIPFARMEDDDGRRLVLWSDVTSCSARGCDVSFGGAFDINGVPLYQLIRIGGFTQQRPIPAGGR